MRPVGAYWGHFAAKRPEISTNGSTRSESRWRRAACPSGGPSGSWGYLPLGGGCALKDSRVSCLLITLSSSSAPASLSRSINPISGRICSWTSSRSCSGVWAGTERVVAEWRRLVMITPPFVPLGDNVTSAARFLFWVAHTERHRSAPVLFYRSKRRNALPRAGFMSEKCLIFSGDAPPIFLRLPLHGRRVGVLHLEPIGRAPRTVGGILPFGNDAFESETTGVPSSPTKKGPASGAGLKVDGVRHLKAPISPSP